MTEEHNKLLAALEVRIQSILELCNAQKATIQQLQTELCNKDDQLKQAQEEILSLKIKCDNVLAARSLSIKKEDMKSARGRLSKLVREVDKCIALLNE